MHRRRATTIVLRPASADRRRYGQQAPEEGLGSEVDQRSAADEQAAAETEAAAIMLQLPAIPDPTWPIGVDDKDNVVVREWADPARPPTKLDGGRKDHVDAAIEDAQSRDVKRSHAHA